MNSSKSEEVFEYNQSKTDELQVSALNTGNADNGMPLLSPGCQTGCCGRFQALNPEPAR
jgi:hypothetical protein